MPKKRKQSIGLLDRVLLATRIISLVANLVLLKVLIEQYRENKKADLPQ